MKTLLTLAAAALVAATMSTGAMADTSRQAPQAQSESSLIVNVGDRGHRSFGHRNRGFGHRGFSRRGFGHRGFSGRSFGHRGFGHRGFSGRGFGHRGFVGRGFGHRGFIGRGYNGFSNFGGYRSRGYYSY